ncbi:MAG: DUF5050 domain-containing protein [Eubacterium sp.]|nr:DUF5050 domain-containing protein [Eubacterium sp.]
MKQDYFNEEITDIEQKSKKRKKKKGKMTFGKFILLVISLAVAALASFIITVKILVPDYDLKQLLPQKVVDIIEGDNKENAEASSTELTTKATTQTETTTQKLLNYFDSKEFKTDDSKAGNQLGNLLNGGKVGTDYNYIYHISKGKGIYRFVPSYEGYSRIYKTDHKLSSMNLRGDYIYFVDETKSKLKKLAKGASKPKTIAEDVKFTYVYDSDIYYITNENALCIMDVKKLEPTTLYFAADSELTLMGVSKHRVFFTVNNGSELEFYTIDNKGEEKATKFRENENPEERDKFVMENGFIYYIEKNDDNDYSIVRQKYGSEKVFALKNTKTNRSYPITDKNRLFYSTIKDNQLVLKEYNMNSKKTKIMLRSNDLDSESDKNMAQIFHGGEYDFIIGGGSYKASSNMTSSNNVMKFYKGNWSY